MLAGSGAVIVLAVLGTFLIVYGKPGSAAPQPAAGNAAQTAPAVDVSFTEVAHGLNSQVAERANYLITSTDELERLWKLIDAATLPPEVDFNKNAVIAVFAGEQPTTGYAISVAKVADAGIRVVSITLKKPDGSCMTGQALTAPYEVVMIPATSLPLAHEDVWTTTSCK